MLRGNGTASNNALIAGNGNSYVAALTGNFGVGLANPADKLSVAGTIGPAVDNAYSLGTSARRFSAIWSANGVIQTSDAREKTDAEPIGRWALEFVAALAPKMYRWRVGGVSLTSEAPDGDARPVNAEEIAAAASENDPRDVVPLYQVQHPGRRAHAGFFAQDVRAAMDKMQRDWGAWGLEDRAEPDSRQFIRSEELLPILWAAVAELMRETDRQR